MEYQCSSLFLPSWLKLPNELFVKTAIKEFKNQSAYAAINKFSDLRLVCKALKEKIDACWYAFLNHVEMSSLFLTSPIRIKLATVKRIIAHQYSILRRWHNATPQAIQEIIAACKEQCLLTNHLGNPELWGISSNREKLERYEILTGKYSTFNLSKPLLQVSLECNPFLVIFEKWIAVRYDTENLRIDILEMKSGNFVTTLKTTDYVLQLRRDGDFLFTLCMDSEGHFKLMKYDSNTWDKPATAALSGLARVEELNLPDSKIHEFHINDSHFIFLTSKEGHYQLLAISKESAFCDSKPNFTESIPLTAFPCIKVEENEFIMITAQPKENENVQGSVIEKIIIGTTAIELNRLLTLPLNFNNIKDFQIHFERAFILKSEGWRYIIDCYDMQNGTLMNEFRSTLEEDADNPFSPQLVFSPSFVRIGLLYSSLLGYGENFSPGTVMLTLNFKTTKPTFS